MQVTFRHSVLFLLHRLSGGGGGLGRGRTSINKPYTSLSTFVIEAWM